MMILDIRESSVFLLIRRRMGVCFEEFTSLLAHCFNKTINFAFFLPICYRMSTRHEFRSLD